MSQDPPSNKSLRKQAIHWLIAQNSGDWSSAEQQVLDAWLSESIEHRQHYQQIQALWQSMDGFKDKTYPQREAAKRYRPPSPSTNVVDFAGSNRNMAIANQKPSPLYSSGSKPLPATPKSPLLRTSRSRSLPRPALALVASILLAIFGLQAFFGISVERYQTLKGEQKTINLADGSQILLNTDTELTVSQSDSQRSVQLNHGEALFSVTHDPLRPFEVIAGSGRLRDIGTRFDVYAQADRVDVAVLEGEVDMIIAHPSVSHSLKAGQFAAYDINGNLLASRLTHMQAVTAWQNGKLIFTDLPLPEALTQIARYHSVEFQIADPKLRELKISGTFKTSNLPLLLKTLEAGFPVKAYVIDPQHIRLQRTYRS